MSGLFDSKSIVKHIVVKEKQHKGGGVTFINTRWGLNKSGLRGLDTPFRRHQTRAFREHATSATAELGGEIHNFSRNRARTHVLLQAQKLQHASSDTFGAFWPF